jgi:HPt (histidine-containing phosphotransfer) domain-containing protein
MARRLADLPLFDDLQIALLREALDEADLAAMMAELPGAVATATEAIVAAADSGDLPEARRAAHVLKGVAGSFGAARLAGAALEIEQDLETIADVVATLPALAAIVDQTTASLPTVVRQPRG